MTRATATATATTSHAATATTTTTSAAALALRPYQLAALDAIEQARADGRHAALIVLPTGTGKTIAFGELVRRWDVPTLILAHRRELLEQPRDKLRLLWPQADIGLIGGGYADAGHRVTIASVQMLLGAAALSAVQTIRPQLVIVDEAHHMPAASYQRIVRALGAGKPGGPFLVGVTATPLRSDAKTLAAIFGEPAYLATLPQMIIDGYLADLRGVRVTTGTDLASVHMRAGDFAEGELAAAVDTPARNRTIVEAWQRRAAGRQTIAFCVTVAHARHLANAFADAGVSAEVVSGDTPIRDRKARLAAFSAGRIQVICNCGVLTEGYDEPQTSCIILARPTRSQGLYIQMAGRGARPAPGKQDCIILDIADVCTRHTLVQLPDLIGGQYTGDAPTATPARVAGRSANDAGGDASDTTTNADDGYSLRDTLAQGTARLADINVIRQWPWRTRPDGGYTLELTTSGDTLAIVPTPTGNAVIGYHVVRTNPRRGSSREYLTPTPLPLGWAQGIAEQAADHLVAGQPHLVSRSEPWRADPVSERQLKFLRKNHVSCAGIVTKGDAADLITIVIARMNGMSR